MVFLIDHPRKERKMSSDLVKETDKSGNVLTHEIIRSEVNFLVFPFFALWDKDVNKKTETEYTAEIQRGNKRVEIEWNVSANPKYGYPGPFDKSFHKAIEEKISQLTPPIENPICIGSLYKLAEKVGVKKIGGSFYERVKMALKRIVTASVSSQGAFYRKDKEKHIDDTFHLYDRVVFIGEMLDNGEIAESNYVYLGSWYLNNINARYVKPVDYDYYQSLSLPIASRLYEILSVKFYGLLEGGGKFIRYRYSTLCDLLPSKRQKYLSWATRIFNPSHEKLVDTEFLSRFSWEKIKGVKGDWYLYYFPGSRAKEEIETFREFRKQKLNKLTPPRNDDTVNEQDKDDKVDEISDTDGNISGDLVYELQKRKISKSVAEQLVEFNPTDYIVKKIKMFDYQVGSGKNFKNPAGWLKSAIEDDYEIDDFEEKYEKKMFREKVRKIRKQKISEALSNFPDKKNWIQQRVDRAIGVRNDLVKNMGGRHPFTDEEIEELREQFRDEYPEAEDEKRDWLSRQPRYSSNAIEKRLMSEEKNK